MTLDDVGMSVALSPTTHANGWSVRMPETINTKETQVLICEPMATDGIKLLNAQGSVLYFPELWQTRTKLMSMLTECDVLIVRNQTQVDEELLRAASKLKVVGRLGVGLDNIDLGLAKQNGVRIVCAKQSNAVAVAEYVMAAMLFSSRPLEQASRDVKQGNWDRSAFTGKELHSKTLGLIGLGSIGQFVARRARAFGMRLVGCDPSIPPYHQTVTDYGVTLCEVDQVLKQSHFVSLHVPLTDSTRGLVGKKELALLKEGAVIINASRGGIIDESALVEALVNDRSKLAVLDVLSIEPPAKDNPLLALPNVYLTPHIAGLTEESERKTATLIAKEIIKVLSGRSSICEV